MMESSKEEVAQLRHWYWRLENDHQADADELAASIVELEDRILHRRGADIGTVTDRLLALLLMVEHSRQVDEEVIRGLRAVIEDLQNEGGH